MTTLIRITVGDEVLMSIRQTGRLGWGVKPVDALSASLTHTPR
ncbi:MAG: hypothetical protein AAF773_03615 [Cyanobacteria bacterium P01_D01_bin.115]